MAEFRAYLETLTFIYLDPRLRSEVSMSDIIQNTLLEAWRELERIEGLDVDTRKRRLRKMLMNNLLDEIEHCRAGKRDFRRKQSLDAAAEESSCRLKAALAVEDTSPCGRLVEEETRQCLLEALSKLDPRQREALIQQKYHGRTLAEIADHLGCTVGVVAGLHARGLKNLHKHLTDMGISDA
jgi:RNA polymerase sigma-70 factor (subfamily 1)